MPPAVAKPLNYISFPPFLLILLATVVMCASPAAAQQTPISPDSVSESQITGMLISTTPIYLLGTCQWTDVPTTDLSVCSDSAAVQMPSVNSPFGEPSNVGTVHSAAFALGNGLFLYAYELGIANLNPVIENTVTRLTIPLGGHAPTSLAAIASGTFVANHFDAPSYTYIGIFAFDGHPNNAADLITSVNLNGVAAHPDSITYGVQRNLIINEYGLPDGVLSSYVFGFISDLPPRFIQGQFGANDSGIYVPPFHMVVPGGITMLDPVPDLLSGPQVTTDPESLATNGRVVQGVAADGVAQVLLRMPTTNVGDQVQFTLQGSGSPNPNDDGALGNPGDTQFSQPSVTVTSVPTSQGPMAFAVYRAPVDFVRPNNSNDSFSPSRQKTLQVQVTSAGGSTPTTSNLGITVIRPPVVLIHGLWADASSWDSFPLLPGMQDPRFSVIAVDYNDPNPVSDSVPAYDPSVLLKARTNSLGFSVNAIAVLSQMRKIVRQFKLAPNNPASLPIAAVQADVVSHSMGGDIARTMPGTNYISSKEGPVQFFNPDTYGQGVIHKLITIATPHLGSPLAIDLLQDQNSCVRNILASHGSISFASVNSGSIPGAVGDLGGDGTGASRSTALSSLFTGLPTAMVAGITGTGNLGGLDCIACTAAYIRFKCGGGQMADNLTSQGWNTLFSGQPNDAIVPVSSQLNQPNSLSSFVASGVIHTAGLEPLDFTGPAELDPIQDIYTQVLKLLNTPVTDTSQFTQRGY